MFGTPKSKFWKKLPGWLTPPHKETKAEKLLHTVQQLSLYVLLFLAGYFVAQVQYLY